MLTNNNNDEKKEQLYKNLACVSVFAIILVIAIFVRILANFIVPIKNAYVDNLLLSSEIGIGFSFLFLDFFRFITVVFPVIALFSVLVRYFRNTTGMNENRKPLKNLLVITFITLVICIFVNGLISIGNNYLDALTQQIGGV